MVKKNSKCVKYFGLALVTMLTVAQVMSTAIVAKAADPVILAPENMVQFNPVDENGNSVSGVGYNIYDLSDVLVAHVGSNGNVIEYNNSGISGGTSFVEPKSTFEAMAAPERFQSLLVKGIFLVENNLNLSFGEEFQAELRTYPSLDVALTVPANTMMINVDSQWANGHSQPIIDANGQSYDLSTMAGTLTALPTPTDGNVYFHVSHNGIGGVASRGNYTLTQEAAEYVKVKVKLKDIAYVFNDDGTYTYEGKDLNIASGQGYPGESMIMIVSGSVINIPVPDSNGYVEFYVENTERKYEYESLHYIDSPQQFANLGGTTGTNYVVNKEEFTIRAVDVPTDKSYMVNVPAGTYTIKVNNVPEGYEKPAPFTFTVQDSQQFQTVNLVLKAQHTHSHATTYSFDATNHWNECDCGDKAKMTAHSFEWIIDKDATESEVGSKHEECSVCGYEKAPVEIPKLNQSNPTTPNSPTNPSNPTTPSNPTAPSNPATPVTPVQADVKDEVPDTSDTFPMGVVVFGGFALVSGAALAVCGKKKFIGR